MQSSFSSSVVSSGSSFTNALPYFFRLNSAWQQPTIHVLLCTYAFIYRGVTPASYITEVQSSNIIQSLCVLSLIFYLYLQVPLMLLVFLCKVKGMVKVTCLPANLHNNTSVTPSFTNNVNGKQKADKHVSTKQTSMRDTCVHLLKELQYR